MLHSDSWEQFKIQDIASIGRGRVISSVEISQQEATSMYVSTNLANPKLMNNTMGNIQIRLPKLEEQKRISVVFRKLHGLLETHNSLIIKYSKQKQYLLSQMFI